MSNPVDLEELKRLVEAAKLPWRAEDGPDYAELFDAVDAKAALTTQPAIIVAAVNALPVLLSQAEETKKMLDDIGEQAVWWRNRSGELEAELEQAREALKQGRYLLPYLDWTLGEESPGHHPTMPSAVAGFKAALRTALGGSHDPA